MKVIIEHQGVKRIIEGPFRVCISRRDAHSLREQLKAADHDEWCYGWVDIRTHEDEAGKPNTPPIGWAEAGR